jgi:trimeric autotransporter adhesin
MKTKISIYMVVLLFSQTITICKAATPPPNPTQSDIHGNTAGGSRVLLNITPIDAFPDFRSDLGNTGFGFEALQANAGGSGNTALGGQALWRNIGGNGNTAIGFQAIELITAGSENTALGNGAGRNLTSGSNNLYLSNPGIASESATIRIGAGSTQKRIFIAGIRGKKTGKGNAVPVMIDSKGQLGTINSSERFKKDIQDMTDASLRLLELRPVTYHYKESDEDESNPLEYGLIAEEVAKIYPDLVAYGADGKIETVQYHKLTPMLVNEVKRLNSLLQSEKDKNVAQTREISDLKTQSQKIALLESRLQAQNQETANLKQQMITLQTQAKSFEALTTRLSRIEATKILGMVE